MTLVWTFLIGWFFLASQVAAKTYSALNHHVLAGECALRQDPESPSARVWPVICLNLEASSQFLFRQKQSELNAGLSFGRIYAGIHINPLVSLHAEGLRRRLYLLSDSDHPIVFDDAITENLFVQIGNRTLTRFSLAVGRVDMPFGTDHRPSMQIFDLSFRNTTYWLFPDSVINLAYDNQVDARIELAYGSSNLNFISQKSKRNERSAGHTPREESRQEEALSLRASYDLSALEGSRLAVSLYEDKYGPRRFGISIANRGSNDRKSAFEWIRTGSLSRPELKFSQLFRLTHATGFRNGNRSTFELELDRQNYRFIALGYDKKLNRQFMMRSALSYYRPASTKEQQSGFALTLGLEAGV